MLQNININININIYINTKRLGSRGVFTYICFLLKGNHKRLLLVTSGYLGYLLQTDSVFLHPPHVQKHPIYAPEGQSEAAVGGSELSAGGTQEPP